MPEVQPHPERPEGGKKYGAYQMVKLPLPQEPLLTTVRFILTIFARRKSTEMAS